MVQSDIWANVGRLGYATKHCWSSILSFWWTRTSAVTQGNYATRDSNDMCHLMPQRHLPEWKEEDEWAFVRNDSWIPTKGLDDTMSATVNSIYMKSL